MTDDRPAPRLRPCPICAKLSVEAYRPFCSKRCADVDLNRWLKGAYAVPADPDDEDGEGRSSPGDGLDSDPAR